jgi:4-amino-4-deoxy-L-arabinose transferase-like glycosyltransferase
MLLLLRLGAVPLIGPDEPRYARVAVEMQRARAWVTPTLQGQPWLEKPPRYYWLAGAAFRCLGENEGAARLPSVLATLALVATTALVGARLYGAAAGLYAGFVLGTSLLVFAYGRAAAMDMLLAACVTAAIGLLALGLLRIAGARAISAAFFFMGLATLAKGPLGVVLPGLVVAAFAIATRDRGPLVRMLSPIGLLLFAAVAAPWYTAISLDQGRAFWNDFLLGHNLARFTSTVHHHAGPLVYYVPVIVAGLFPWSGLVIPALAGASPGRSRSDLFLLLWFLLPLLFFSAAGSKLPGYILPCLPPLAILMGRSAEALAREQTGAGWTRLVALVGLALGSLVATAPFYLGTRLGEPAWRLLLPSAVWALGVMFLVSRRLDVDPAAALQLLRVGAAGFLLLLTGAAPQILAHQQSGRDLFAPAHAREVLALGAWRTAWMAGYFYNDGHVREIGTLADVVAAAAAGPVLVLAGPHERGAIEASPELRARALAEGARANALLRVEKR